MSNCTPITVVTAVFGGLNTPVYPAFGTACAPF
jgi:hypothetical protein